jgi:hypothetical protein
LQESTENFKNGINIIWKHTRLGCKLFYIPDAKAHPKSGLFEPLDAIMKNEQKMTLKKKSFILFVLTKGRFWINFARLLTCFIGTSLSKQQVIGGLLKRIEYEFSLQRDTQEDDVSKNCNERQRAHNEE